MISKIFVNLPIEDLDKSMAFFKAIGFSFNPQFTDKTAACMVPSGEAIHQEADRRRSQDDRGADRPRCREQGQGARAGGQGAQGRSEGAAPAPGLRLHVARVHCMTRHRAGGPMPQTPNP